MSESNKRTDEGSYSDMDNDRNHGGTSSDSVRVGDGSTKATDCYTVSDVESESLPTQTPSTEPKTCTYASTNVNELTYSDAISGLIDDKARCDSECSDNSSVFMRHQDPTTEPYTGSGKSCNVKPRACKSDQIWSDPERKERNLTKPQSPGTSLNSKGQKRKRSTSSPFDQRPVRRQRTCLDKQFTIASCPPTCPCKTRGRDGRIPHIERSFGVQGPYYKDLLQERSIEVAKLHRLQCCDNNCSSRWSRKRRANDEGEDERWPESVNLPKLRRRLRKYRKL